MQKRIGNVIKRKKGNSALLQNLDETRSSDEECVDNLAETGKSGNSKSDDILFDSLDVLTSDVMIDDQCQENTDCLGFEDMVQLFCNDENVGPKLDQKLADAINSGMRARITEESMKVLFDKHPRPEKSHLIELLLKRNVIKTVKHNP